MSGSAAHLRIIEETPAYWRVVLDNPPLNIMGASIFEGLQDLLARMDASPSLRVVVFESANPEFAGVRPGGGGTERLPPLVGRGRALEIILGANDFDGETAERYGYVNRVLPDAELDGFVDLLARRIASFDRRPIAAAKNLINQVSLPPVDRLLDGLTSFTTALTWPESQRRFQALSNRGLGQPGEMENRFGELLGTLLET
jgi:enoyl-CoA hydratase/carnithine racemase